MEKEVDEIEDWEDYETIDEAWREIKRLLQENARLREENNQLLTAIQMFESQNPDDAERFLEERGLR